MWCAARGDSAFSALTWISQSEPALVENEFNAWNTSSGCNLLLSNCASWRGWPRVNSMTRPVSALLDYRWNDLPLVVTPGNHTYNTAIRPIKYEGDVWQVIISVLARSNAFIVFCEGDDPHGSACYWVILGGWITTSPKSVIRKCPYGVPSGAVKRDCKELNNRFYAPETVISDSKWAHVKVILDRTVGNELSLRVSDGDHDVLDCIDGFGALNVRYFFVGSNMNEGRFRIQNYDYLQGRAKEELTGKVVSNGLRTRCWSILYSFDADARETPHLEVKLRSSHFFNERVIARLYSTKGIWKHEKIVVDIEQEWSTLVITGKDGSNSFAVGGIQECYPNGDIRTSKELIPGPNFRDDDLSCQALDSSQDLRFTNLDFSYTDCEDCSLNCKQFGISELNKADNCVGVQLCQRTKSSGNVCFCTAGYRGKFCYELCSNSYGVNCKEKCGKCKYGAASYCNLQTGSCRSGCDPGYKEPLCQKTYPILINPPECVASTMTSITVHTNNNGTKGEGDPVSYTLQFTVADDLRSWMSFGTYAIDSRPLLEVKNLSHATKYAFRAILIDRDNGNYSKDDVPYSIFETKCNHPNVELCPSSRSVEVWWKELDYPCPKVDYGFHINGLFYYPHIKTDPFEAVDLKPFESYEWKIFYKKSLLFEGSIRTLEDVPSPVEDLEVAKMNQTTLFVSWSAPRSPNGVLKTYRISYQYCSSLACPWETCVAPVEEIVFSEQTSITLHGLKAFSKYYVLVAASTFDYGNDSVILAETPGFGILRLAPQFEREPEVKEREIRVSWTAPHDCSTIDGKIAGYQVTLMGLNFQSELIISDRYTYSFKNLTPFSTYELKILIQGEAGLSKEEFAIRRTVTTKADAPPMVRNATAFAYGDSWIHLRWGKPDPPHGVLEYYKVAYGLGDPRTTEIVKVDEYCDLWEGLICGKIEGLKKDREYNIRIAAKNRDIKNLGEFETFKIRTAEGVPDRPDNVAAISVSASEMLLNWEHPYITRGRLRSFKVDIMLNSTGLKNYKSYEDTKELFVKKDKKFYSMKVCDLQPASEYKIVIYGVTQSPGETDTVFGKTLLPVPDVGSQLEYDPESITNTTFKILVPAADDFVTKESGFIIIVTSKSAVSEDLEKSRLFKEMKEEKIILATAGVSDWRNSWVAAELKPGERNQLEIGSNGIQDNGCHFITYGKNRPLVPGGSYEVTLVALYKWNDDYKAKAIKLKDPVKTPLVYVIPEETSVIGWVILALLLICVVPAVAFFVLRRKKLMRKKDDSVELRAHAIATNDNPLTLEVELYGPQLAPSQRFSRRVAIGDLEQYIRTGILSGELQRQHALFPRGQTRPWDYGKLPENKSKNRYGNLVAYDETRVKLKKFPGDPFSDYINANFINGYNAPKFYIATQGPKRNTVVDFWRMVWQEHVQVIVMLANTVENGKAKCEQYWPEFGQDVVHGAAHIVNASNQIFADYTYRLLNVTCKGKMRKIHHLHFTSWPDHGVPLYTQSVSSFLKKLLATPPGTGPIVVHCSAGVGRTGSIILCDICLRMAAAEGSVDILGFQQQIREQRANMVDNLDQYKLVHMVLLDCLATEPLSYTCDKNFASRVTELSTSGVIQRQFLRLGNMRWQDEVLRPTKGEGGDSSPAQKDKFKNRNLGIVPGRNGRVYISSFPFDDPHSNYINAVYVDGFRAKDQFVVTQFPLQSTVGDFWRLVHEKNISLVVVLNEIDVEDKSVCTFWPLGETENLKPMPHLTVSKKQEINSTYCRNYHLQLMVDEEEDTKRLVNVLHLKDWQSDENLPPSTSVILELWQEAERLCSGKDPIAVCCLDGATASGYFVALAFLIEKIKLEQQCDVCQAVRTVRQNREQFVATCEQFEYLYKAAVTYLDTFQIYANFG